jgi:hypothetical protein
MRIVLKSGTTEHVLCDGHVDGTNKSIGPLAGMQTSAPISVDEARPVRATTATPYSRGNRLFTLAFSVVRECDSAKAAEAYCLTHPRDVLRAGTLYVFAEGSSGDRQPYTLANAVLREVVCTHTGVSVTIAYTVVGGQLT